VENGYVFSAPPTWLVGPSRRYLVNEAQKMAIFERMRRIWQVLDPACYACVSAWVMAMVMANSLKLDDWWQPMALMLAVPMLIAVPAQIYAIHKLRPLLAGLPPTRERGLTWSERFKLQAAHTSWSLYMLVVGGFVFAYVCLMLAIEFGQTVQKTGPVHLVLTSSMVLSCAALAALAAYCFAFASYKARRT
jgi:hypothetical protein